MKPVCERYRPNQAMQIPALPYSGYRNTGIDSPSMPRDWQSPGICGAERNLVPSGFRKRTPMPRPPLGHARPRGRRRGRSSLLIEASWAKKSPGDRAGRFILIRRSMKSGKVAFIACAVRGDLAARGPDRCRVPLHARRASVGGVPRATCGRRHQELRYRAEPIARSVARRASCAGGHRRWPCDPVVLAVVPAPQRLRREATIRPPHSPNRPIPPCVLLSQPALCRDQ